MITVAIKKQIKLPDPVAVARYEKSPELGPKILFFSGGTALRELSARLIRFTHNSIHVVTPFDSGGSSAKLRDAFRIPAVGDIRNRLMALADQTLQGNPEIYALFAYRLSPKKSKHVLLAELARMAKGEHSLVEKIPDPLRKIVRHHLHVFMAAVPDTFDPRGASVGNIVLTAGFLSNRRHLDPVIFIFSKLVQVRGIVRPIVNKDLHLAAEMENGKIILGQHRLTGKEVPPINKKVSRVFLTKNPDSPVETQVAIRAKTSQLIGQADLICYPMGSFYTSIVANLLPRGVGWAVQKNPCPKVYIPNTDRDPEAYGLDVAGQVEQLIAYLRKDDPDSIAPSQVLDFVLLDSKMGRYRGRSLHKRLRALGVEVIDIPLLTPETAPYIDSNLLIPILLSLA
jgi:CofD-related protein of GAK system